MILALETATDVGDLALLQDDVVLAEQSLGFGPAHAGPLLGALDLLFARSGRRLEDVELIALSIGPGSFTGLRVGLASALGLCFGTSRRIVPVPTLAALALRAPGAARVVPLLDARRGQVYTGLYTAEGEVVREDRVCEPRLWFEDLKNLGALTLIGSGAELYRRTAQEILGSAALILPPERGRPRALEVGRLGQRLAAEGAARPPEEVEPRYLQRPEAELRRATGGAKTGAGHPSPKPII